MFQPAPGVAFDPEQQPFKGHAESTVDAAEAAVRAGFLRKV